MKEYFLNIGDCGQFQTSPKLILRELPPKSHSGILQMPVTSSWRIFSKLQKAGSISGVGNLIAVGNFTSKWNVGVIWITSVSLGSFLLTSTLKLCRYFFRYQKPQSIWSKLLLKIQLHMKGGTNFKNLVLRSFLLGILQAIRLLTEAPPPAKHHVQLVTAESEQIWKSDLNI